MRGSHQQSFGSRKATRLAAMRPWAGTVGPARDSTGGSAPGSRPLRSLPI
jgi:hypothetical protein